MSRRPRPVKIPAIMANVLPKRAPAATAAAKVDTPPPPKPLIERTWMGAKVERFSDGFRVTRSDGTVIQATGIWSLLKALFSTR